MKSLEGLKRPGHPRFGTCPQIWGNCYEESFYERGGGFFGVYWGVWKGGQSGCDESMDPGFSSRKEEMEGSLGEQRWLVSWFTCCGGYLVSFVRDSWL